MAANDNIFKRRGLGRGLGALIMDTQSPRPAPAPEPPDSGGVRLLTWESISPNPHQPRGHFDPGALDELAASIREHGIIQPLIVTQQPQQPDTYWLVAGERRWRAARLADLTAVPAIVREASPQQLVEWALVENLQRADLSPLEEAAAYQSLLDEFGLTQAEIGTRVGKSRSAIANTLRLLHLPADAQTALVDERISAGHARALLALPDQALITQALAHILAHDLSVRQTEELVKRLSASAAPPDPQPEPEDMAARAPDADWSHLEDRLRAALGTRVNLTRNRDGSGRLTVHFYSDEDLNQIYHLIAGDDDI
jgi:ParB family chromosome partitioning protein